MTEHKLNNKYVIILFALSALLDRFEIKDWLFAAKCILWLAIIIQVTEIVSYYRHYEIFPSEYVNDWVVTPLKQPNLDKELSFDSDISSIDISGDSDKPVLQSESETPISEHWTRLKLHPSNRISGNANSNTTHSGMIFKQYWYQQISSY